MPIIDTHIHLFPNAINRDPAGWATDSGEAHWATLCTRKRPNGQPVQGFPNVKELLRAMDAAGVARGVLLGWYWEKPETCAMQNRFYAKCVKAHPDRLSAFATLHPGAGRVATLKEVTRAHESGLIGLGELSPHSQGYAINDPVFGEVLSLAAKLDMPVNLHVTEPRSRAYPGKVKTPLTDFLKLAKAHPQTTLILAHWGGRLPLVSKRKIPDNLYYDTAASPLLYPQSFWREFCAKVPAERVLFGSDYPLNLYPGIDDKPQMGRLIAEVHRSELNAEQLRAIVYDNACKVLRLG